MSGMGDTQHITLKVKDVFGLRKYYPACKQSELFARLTGTKTLTIEKLKLILALGYELHYITEFEEIK
jgi:hypothetical protein